MSLPLRAKYFPGTALSSSLFVEKSSAVKNVAFATIAAKSSEAITTLLSVKGFFVATVLVYLSLAAHPALADYRIGIVNVERVMNESSSGKQRRLALDAKAKQAREDVNERRTSLQKQEEALKAKKVTNDSPEAQKLREEVKSFNRFVGDAEESLKREFAKNNEALAKDVVKTVSEVAKEKDIAVVLDGSQQHRSAVLFHDAQLDITQDVMKRLQ